MATVRRPLVIVLIVVLALVVFAGGWLIGRLGIGKVVDPESLTEAERQFAERMRGVTLVGSFTTDGEDRPPQADRYDIVSVEKASDDLWRFNSKCCGLNGAVPFVVPMRFNGDTPMVMMTEMSLPGLGTFSARVFFYGDRYAGTWQHGEVGGHMWGRIEKTAAPAAP
ncbi:MAG TPA: hypothetical protein VF789_14735 [Thermoanaerobaculia bacterium]